MDNYLQTETDIINNTESIVTPIIKKNKRYTETEGNDYSTDRVKTYSMRLLDPKGELKLKKEIDTYFDDPDLFLKPTNQLVVNKKIKYKDFNQIQLENKTPFIFKDFSLKKSAAISRPSIFTKSNESGNSVDRKPLIENVCKESLKALFESFRVDSSKKTSKKRINTLDYQNYLGMGTKSQKIPNDIKEALNNQSRALERKNSYEKSAEKLIKSIARRTNKKEEDVLMNRVDLYRLKKQIVSHLPNSLKTNDEIFAKNRWSISLRRPDNFIGVRNVLVRDESSKNQFWTVVREKSPVVKVIAINPDIDIKNKEYTDFVRNPIFKLNENAKNIRRIEGIDNLRVDGVNLLDMEYKNAMNSKNGKLLKSVLVENGKAILEKDVNDLYGYESIYKNYENNNRSKIVNSRYMDDDYD